MKTIILVSNLLFLTVLLIFINREKVLNRWEETEYSYGSYTIPAITRPNDLELLNDSLFILKQNELVEWSVSQRVVLSSKTIPQQSILGTDENKLFVCSWQNFEIRSPKEYATLLTYKELGQSEREIWLHKTIKPIKCSGEEIIAMNALPILQEKYYKISTRTKKIREVAFIDDFMRKDLPGINIDEQGKIIVTVQRHNPLKKRVLQLLLN